jgi:hypothetical protein
MDVGSLLPADPDCRHNVRAKCMPQALGLEGSTHGPPVKSLNPVGGVTDINLCGDLIRWQVIHPAQQKASPVAADESEDARGAPDFNEWPVWNDVTHQKMWVEWIRRAYEAGL